MADLNFSRRGWLAAAAALLAAGCDRLGGKTAFKAIDITGVDYGREL